MFNSNFPVIAITPGEPAGIGPDITLYLAQKTLPAKIIVIADREILRERAALLDVPIKLLDYQPHLALPSHSAGELYVLHVPVQREVHCGIPRVETANYVLQTLTLAAQYGLAKTVDAVVTAPVHKAIINDAGIEFHGHTEFFEKFCKVPRTVMLFVAGTKRLALATVHIPLMKVSQTITQEYLTQIIKILHQDLQNRFLIKKPKIAIAGLNPHAGENGYLGREEIDVLQPVINQLNTQGFDLLGPLSADILFTDKYWNNVDVVLAMYHDQGLPVMKHQYFGELVNVTLGLPFIRTSVDHGTACDIAGTGQAKVESLEAAFYLAIEMIGHSRRGLA